MKDDRLLDSERYDYDNVLDFISQEKHCSLSMLQIRFFLNYNTAARLMEKLIAKGIIRKHEGTIYKYTQEVSDDEDNAE